MPVLNKSGEDLPEVGGYPIPEHKVVVRERRVVLRGIRVKERPDQTFAYLQETGKLGVPVFVTALLEVDEKVGMWPLVQLTGMDPQPGMWFDSLEEWEKEEDRFKRMLAEELERLRWELKDVKGDLTGAGRIRFGKN